MGALRSAKQLERALSGKAVTTGDGMLHIEREPGTTLCGEPVESYPLHWDITTWIACGVCLFEAGVPLAAGREVPEEAADSSPGRRLPESNRWRVPEATAQPCGSGDDDDPRPPLVTPERRRNGEAEQATTRADGS